MLKIKTVVTPVDFSENAQKIALMAADVAARFEAELRLVFVVQNFEDYSGFFVPPVNMPSLEDELLKSAQQRMDTFMEENKQAIAAAGVKHVQATVLHGDVAEEIVRYADEVKSDLIVMGTHGYKGLEKVMFGSVADKVVKKAECPVLTVNPYRHKA